MKNRLVTKKMVTEFEYQIFGLMYGLNEWTIEELSEDLPRKDVEQIAHKYLEFCESVKTPHKNMFRVRADKIPTVLEKLEGFFRMLKSKGHFKTHDLSDDLLGVKLEDAEKCALPVVEGHLSRKAISRLARKINCQKKITLIAIE